MLAGFDSQILNSLAQGEGTISIKRKEESATVQRSTVLSQAIHHATEHRAQLIDALEFKGFAIINLDDIDLWSFESSVG